MSHTPTVGRSHARRAAVATFALIVMLGTTVACSSSPDGASDGTSDDPGTSVDGPDPVTDPVIDGSEAPGDGPTESPGDDAGNAGNADDPAGDDDNVEPAAADDPAPEGESTFVWAGLGGNAKPAMPDSDDDVVVLSGAYQQVATTDHWFIAVVAMNNTDETVYSMAATATASDAAGTEVQTSMAFGLQPLAVEPGGLAIGTVMITSADLDGSENVDVAVTSDAEPSESEFDLQPSDVSYHADDGEVVATVTNTAAQTAGSPLMLELGCFTEAGEIIGIVEETALGSGDVAPGESSSVSVEPGYYINECPTFLVAASGFAEE